MFARIENGAVTEYPIADIRPLFPNTSFPAGLPDDCLPDGYVRIHDAAAPAVNPMTHKAVPVTPVQADGLWVQGWEIKPLSAAEIAQRQKALVPRSVTMRQARLALLGGGLLSQVDAAIEGMSEPEKSTARIEWEYSMEVRRDSALVLSLAPVLGLDDAQLDALFIAAAKL